MRFSLRTLLIAMLVMPLLLGVAWSFRSELWISQRELFVLALMTTLSLVVCVLMDVVRKKFQ